MGFFGFSNHYQAKGRSSHGWALLHSTGKNCGNLWWTAFLCHSTWYKCVPSSTVPDLLADVAVVFFAPEKTIADAFFATFKNTTYHHSMELKEEVIDKVHNFVGHSVNTTCNTMMINKNICELLMGGDNKCIRLPRRSSAMNHRKKLNIISSQITSMFDKCSSYDLLTFSSLIFIIELLKLGYSSREIFQVFAMGAKARPTLNFIIMRIRHLTSMAHKHLTPNPSSQQS